MIRELIQLIIKNDFYNNFEGLLTYIYKDSDLVDEFIIKSVFNFKEHI